MPKMNMVRDIRSKVVSRMTQVSSSMKNKATLGMGRNTDSKSITSRHTNNGSM